tara:strand:- start:777 stop:1241 length:465 start_codon:yes stop_codon:yes gene_type:complete
MEVTKELPLRIGVGIILLNKDNNVFVGRRIDNPKKFWQMPQGGVDKNESFLQAAKRELKEETGITSIKVVKKINGWFTYNLPKNLLGKIWKGKFRGQKQKWFVMSFQGNDKEININADNPEFLDWKWIKPSDLPAVAVHFKINIYKRLLLELSC